jgi:hypothetical protein
VGHGFEPLLITELSAAVQHEEPLLIILPPIIEMGRTASEMAHPPIAVFLVVYVSTSRCYSTQFFLSSNIVEHCMELINFKCRPCQSFNMQMLV